MHCHSDQSEAKSKNPAMLPLGIATGSLGFAGDDSALLAARNNFYGTKS
jgi:hypothetical protein